MTSSSAFLSSLTKCLCLKWYYSIFTTLHSYSTDELVADAARRRVNADVRAAKSAEGARVPTAGSSHVAPGPETRPRRKSSDDESTAGSLLDLGLGDDWFYHSQMNHTRVQYVIPLPAPPTAFTELKLQKHCLRECKSRIERTQRIATKSELFYWPTELERMA